jgi:hypothetical protein
MRRTYLYGVLFFLIFSGQLSAQSVSTTGMSHFDSLGILLEFKFYTLQGQEFNTDSLKKGMHRTVLIYFNTNCEYCLSEFILIKKNMVQFPKTNFILISGEEMPVLLNYDSLRQFSLFPQIRVVQDRDHVYHHLYTSHYTPSIHIYNRKGKLLHFSDGKMTREELIRFLEK